MALLSMRARKRIQEIAMIGLLGGSVMVLQDTILNRFPVQNVFCNLPLTIVIVWGAVFGTRMPPITPDELRVSSAGQIFMRQLASGSASGLLLGAFFAALYASVLPIYPFYLPLTGWIAGYFCLRHINKGNFLIMPLVLVLSGLGEVFMATQLFISGREVVFDRLTQFVVPEAILNTLIAPFVYLPMRRWYDVANADTPVKSA